MIEAPGWKTAASWTCATLISLLFLISGIWKITDPTGAAVRMAQARVPESLSLATAVLFGTAETFTGVLILVPRFRRWGAWLASLMLLVFLAYFAINYSALRGEDCSCFPWIRRFVGPGFFISDGIMLAMAILAGLWAKRSESMRSAILVLGAVSVFALVSYGVTTTYESGTRAPAMITVDGKPFSTQEGKILIYFFDPECLHCLDAGRRMSKLNWGDTKIVIVATAQPQFAEGFLRDTGLKAGISPDLALLRKTFPFTSPPAAVALENGREKAALTQFEGDEPAATLRRLGLIY